MLLRFLFDDYEEDKKTLAQVMQKKIESTDNNRYIRKLRDIIDGCDFI